MNGTTVRVCMQNASCRKRAPIMRLALTIHPKYTLNIYRSETRTEKCPLELTTRASPQKRLFSKGHKKSRAREGATANVLYMFSYRTPAERVVCRR